VFEIFKSVFEKLPKDPKFTFTIGDIGFFRRYYNTVSSSEKAVIKKLIADEQLEIVHGGMVSTDEACTDYADILRNFEQAHDFLWQEFQIKPKIGWQLDPFGHSAANASLFAEMGLEAMVFARINE